MKEQDNLKKADGEWAYGNGVNDGLSQREPPFSKIPCPDYVHQGAARGVDYALQFFAIYSEPESVLTRLTRPFGSLARSRWECLARCSAT